AAAEADAAALKCPKCDGVLKEIAYEGVQLDQCTACNGIWLDAGELERLTQNEDSGGWLRRLFQGTKGE
ncbi:MAG TPA: zf-TFIIB domain-containing protein, partial [Blastocatellia bacterium]|nr:zf-TFIIB domain-containing protein [Blastocatellia bacterium]